MFKLQHQFNNIDYEDLACRSPSGLQRPLRYFEYPGCALGQSRKASVLG